MTYKLSEPGWFSEVNGIRVANLPLPLKDGDFELDDAGSFIAHNGIELHRQQGPGDDIRGTQISRGYPICTWNIGPSGTVNQYCHMFRYAPWHGDSVSQYAFGIEVAGNTGTPENAAQLKAEMALCAAIIEYTEDALDELIPVANITHVGLDNYRTVKGQWNHKNVVPGSSLNEKGHVDFMEGMAMSAFLKGVKGLLPGSKPIPPFPGILKLGDDSAAVLKWKRRMKGKGVFNLNDANNGPHFGKGLENATILFQKKKFPGKPEEWDGKVGPKTWAAAWGG